MVLLKGNDADRLIAAPDDRFPLVLVYGRDAGLVSECVQAYVAHAAPSRDDPFAVLRLDGDAIAADPPRLADEANTIALFGGKRVIWVRLGSKSLNDAVQPLLRTPPADARVIIEGGDLAKSAPLVSAMTRAANAAVIVCYQDSGRELDRLIDEELVQAGLRVSPELRRLLQAQLGGDRRASRAELAKLALYAHGEGELRAEHVDAVSIDATEAQIDPMIDAAMAGDFRLASVLLGRLTADGVHASQVLSALLRHMYLVSRCIHEVSRGSSVPEVIKSSVPYFRRHPAVTGQVRNWTLPALLNISGSVQEAVLLTRRMPRLDHTVVERVLLGLSREAARQTN
jgi:DNA polymerase-3 subunit delta